MSEDDPKARALELIIEAWEQALTEGVEPEIVASVAMYAALADMVDHYGEEAIADFCASLPERVRQGEFTLRGDS